MNQTTKIVLSCLAFMVLLIKVCRLLHSSAGNYVPNMVVADTADDNKNKVWTDAYKAQVKAAIYVQTDTLLVLPAQREELANCVTDRFKRLFPRGIEVVRKDSLQLLSQRAFKSCLKDMTEPAVLKWQPTQDQSLREALNKQLASSKMPSKTRIKYCDCIVNSLHQRYAAGIKGEMSGKVIKHTADSCAARILFAPGS
jgi:hypothetical protein